MGFRSILGDVVKVGGIVAPEVVSGVNPAAGAIAQLVVNGIIRAEQSGTDGASKKQEVVNAVLPTVEPTIRTMLQTTGGTASVDPQIASQAIGHLVDTFVALLNSVQVPDAPAATAASGPAAKAQG